MRFAALPAALGVTLPVTLRAILPVTLAAALLANFAAAATAYVSDELVLGVYTEQNSQGPRLATLHSGARVETLNVSGDFTQVRLNDGTTGWVKSTYLTTTEPATVRVKGLEEELDRNRATMPELAAAAAHSEVLTLRRDLAAAEAKLAVRQAAAPARGGAPAGASVQAWTWVLAMLVGVSGGFWLGYAALARRVRQRFGGLKVY